MADQLALAIAHRFVQRKDVKAVQYENGYVPVRQGKDGPYVPWAMSDVEAHLAGTVSYGHYLVDRDNMTKLFAFDIDLTKIGRFPLKLDYTCFDDEDRFVGAEELINPREAWRDRRHPSRNWLKWQLGSIAGLLAGAASRHLELPVAASYSGNKGIHVYCFTGTIPAAEARQGAELVLASLGCFELERGHSLYRHKDQSVLGYPNVNVEVYPKQGDLDGKDFGNLMRLPLGRNLKSKDPTFFLDMRTRVGALTPHSDPLRLLRTGNPWK